MESHRKHLYGVIERSHGPELRAYTYQSLRKDRLRRSQDADYLGGALQLECILEKCTYHFVGWSRCVSKDML